MNVDYKYSPEEGNIFLRFTGDFDVYHDIRSIEVVCSRLVKELRDIHSVFLDITDLTHVNSTFVSAFLTCKKILDQFGVKKYVIIAGNIVDKIKKLLSIFDLDIPVYRTLEEVNNLSYEEK